MTTRWPWRCSALGADVLLVPTYTPLRTDEENVSDSHLFFGGINVFLQQHSSIFRHTPWFVDALLDRPGVIQLVTRGGPRIEAEKLGGLTVSMLQGEHGQQRKEVRKLVHWIKHEARPDMVHLSNAMLIGVAARDSQAGHPGADDALGRRHLSGEGAAAVLCPGAAGAARAGRGHRRLRRAQSVTTPTTWPSISTCRASGFTSSRTG